MGKIKAIEVGKYIKQTLLENPNISSHVKVINTWVAPNGTDFPYIIFYRTSVTPTYTKDGYIYSDVSFDIDVIHNNYDKSVELAQSIVECLNLKVFNTDEIRIKNLKVTNISESFQYDSFVQKLSFTAQAN
jgi:hypothetical protein